MKKLLLIGFLMLSLNSFSQTVDLSVRVSNIKEIKGNMSIAIFNNADGFPSSNKFFIGKNIPINSTDFIYTFKNIPVDEYAIAIYHDINKNGKLNTNWFGIPTEPYGFSYAKKGEIGSASFKEALFNLKESTELNIDLIH